MALLEGSEMIFRPCSEIRGLLRQDFTFTTIPGGQSISAALSKGQKEFHGSGAPASGSRILPAFFRYKLR